MRISLALLPLALTLSLYAQDAAPVAAPAATPADDQPVLTIKRNSHLVVLDVVVTDSKQSPISGLQPTDFTILEKGKPQTILNFDEHGPSAQAAPPPMPNLPPNTFTNYKPVAEDGPLNILLFDAIDTSMVDQAAVRSQMLKFLDTMQPGTRIAIFSLSNRLRLAQGFTSDRELLRAALNDKKSMPKGSILLNDTVNGDTLGNETARGTYSSVDSDADKAFGGIKASSEAHEATISGDMGITDMISGMTALAHYLAGFPGRKNLVWFAGLFPANIARMFSTPTQVSTNAANSPQDNQNQQSMVAMNSFQPEFRETTDLFTQSQVAIYPVDTRGEEILIAPAFTAAGSGQTLVGGDLGIYATFRRDQYYNQPVMDGIAADTGGKGFGNNDMKAELQNIISLGSHYYTIAYTPPDGKWDGEFRDINVKVDQPDTQLYFRHGYYADDPDKPVASHVATAVPPPSAMGTAMLPGAPEPTQIVFAAQIVPVSLTPNPAAVAGNTPGPKVHGPYLEYAVHYGIDPRNIVPQITPDGVHHGKLELTALLYDADGTLVNSASENAAVTIDDKILQQGLHITQNLSVPVDPKRQHGYTFRVGVHDVNGDRVGALEVPVSAIHDPNATVSAAAVPAKQ
jgi:VWFA-related protein